jgi:hypothetical protein
MLTLVIIAYSQEMGWITLAFVCVYYTRLPAARNNLDYFPQLLLQSLSFHLGAFYALYFEFLCFTLHGFEISL